MKVRCIDDCDTLTKGKEYGDDKYTIPECGNCYFLRGNDGTERYYLKSRFEEAEGILNGEYEITYSSEKKEIGNIYNFIDGRVENFLGYLDINHCTKENINKKFSTFLKPYKKPKLKAWELEENKIYLGSDGYKYNVIDYDKLVIFVDDKFVNCSASYNTVANMEFTEINPNKERIEELKKEIERSKMKIEVTGENIADLYENISLYKDSAELENQLINSYEAELKELEGQE